MKVSPGMSHHRVVIVGAGMAGLSSALALAASGVVVTLLERGQAPGGKIRQLGGIDSGPTVFTMRWVFEELFAQAALNFADHVSLQALPILARHAWDERSQLDLFADEERSVAAIGAFAGAAEAARYRSFCRDTKRIYDILETPFLRAGRPSMAALLGANGFRGLFDLPEIKPFSSMAAALAQYFHDPRLRQLFGRYATYCGSSPYLAPATLMLIAHVERDALPDEPTVYVCAQDRNDDDAAVGGEERLLVLINAPANGDRHIYSSMEVERCAQATFGVLERCGLTIAGSPPHSQVTTPTDFNKLFPATGGALYGRSSHGWTASFQRPGVRTKLPGLYLAGGSVHPGPGVPMAALSGRAAAACLLADLTSRAPSRATAMRGGMSTR